MDRAYNLKEAASFLGVSYRTIRRYLKRGLPYTEVKGDKSIEYRLAEPDLIEFKKARLERPKQGATLDNIYGVSKKNIKETNNYARTVRTNKGGVQGGDDLTQKIIEILETENVFLKEQIAGKDRQLAEFEHIIDRLSRQNEVLAMKGEGAEPKAPAEEGKVTEQDTSSPVKEEERVIPAEQEPLSKEETIAETKRLHKEGKSADEIRQFILQCGYKSFSELLQKS